MWSENCGNSDFLPFPTLTVAVDPDHIALEVKTGLEEVVCTRFGVRVLLPRFVNERPKLEDGRVWLTRFLKGQVVLSSFLHVKIKVAKILLLIDEIKMFFMCFTMLDF